MDISDLLPILAAFIVIAASVFAFHNARRIAGRLIRPHHPSVHRPPRRRVPLRLLRPPLLQPQLHPPPSPTQLPDGSHLAITTYTVNTGTADQAEIAIRHTWSPLSHRVYAGPAQYQPNATTPDPNVQWLDSTHLRIRFNTYSSTTQSPDLTPQGCAPQADGVTIVCEQTLIHATK